MIQCCTELHQVLHQVNQMYQGGTSIAYTGQTMTHTCLLKPKSLLRTMVWLTLPPHCSHNMQPLDRSVCGTVITNHPGQTIIIHNVAKILGKAFPLAFIPKNIYILASVHLILMTSVRKNFSAYIIYVTDRQPVTTEKPSLESPFSEDISEPHHQTADNHNTETCSS